MSFESKLPQCGRCPFYGHEFVPPSLVRGSKIFLVGDSPYYNEVKQNEVFVGPAGAMLNACLDEAGIDRSSISISNSIHCAPEKLGTPFPSGTVELCTKLFLKREIEFVQPEIIVPMGNAALKALVPKERGNISKVRGTERQIEFFDKVYRMLPTFHPSFLLRSPSFSEYMINDLKLAAGTKIQTANGENSNVKYRHVNTIERLEHFFKEVDASKIMALDLETTSLDYRTAAVLSMNFSFKEGEAYIITFFTGDESQFENKTTTNVSVAEKLWALLHDDGKRIFFHNGKFDLRMLHEWFTRLLGYGIDIDKIRWYENMAGQGLLDENMSQKLKIMTPMYTPLRYNRSQVDEVTGGKIKKMSKKDLTEYGGIDCDATRRIGLKLTKELHDKGLWYGPFIGRDYSDMSVGPVLFKMELFGAPINRTKMAEIRHLVEGKLKGFELQMWKVSKKKFNVRSTDQLRHVMYNVMNYPETGVKTKGGKDSTDKNTMALLMDDYPDDEFLIALDYFRKYDSIYKTFVKGLQERLGPDGRLHPDFGFTRTVSGRIVCYNPNLANIPRAKEFEEGIFLTIREMFTARPGWRIVMADFAQVEYRVAALLSKDQKMIDDIFLHHQDFHDMIARSAYPQYEKAEAFLNRVKNNAMTDELERRIASAKIKLKDWRTDAKRFNFASIFGAEEETLAKNLNVSVERVNEIIDGVEARYPNFWKFIKESGEKALEVGDIVNAFGRHRRMPPTPDERVTQEQGRKFMNFLPQCHVFGTKVLLPDLTWRFVENINVGDVIVGFEAGTERWYGRRHWKTTEVLKADHVYYNCFEIQLDNGDSMTVTPEHWHLTVNKNGFQTWVRTTRLRHGPNTQFSRLSKVIFPTDKANDWDAGYIAGMFDADGHFANTIQWERNIPNLVDSGGKRRGLYLGQLPNVALERTCEILSRYNFEFSNLLHKSTDNANGFRSVRILGGRSEILRFLQLFRPPRLLSKMNFDVFGMIETYQAPKVLDVVYVGRKKIVRLQTSEETYVADGYATHNSNAGYIGRGALVRIAKRCEKEQLQGYPFNVVYDQIICECPEEETNDIKYIMAEEMLRPVPELDDRVFGIELGDGESWHSAEINAKKLFAVDDLEKVFV